MTDLEVRPLSFWRTVRVLLRAARARAVGRRRRAQELLRQRTGRESTDWSGFGTWLSVLFMAMLNILAAVLLISAVRYGATFEIQGQGKLVVSDAFLTRVENTERNLRDFGTPLKPITDYEFHREAERVANRTGLSELEAEDKLREIVKDQGSAGLVSRDELNFEHPPKVDSVPAMLGSLVLLWWVVMLVCQGEGLELNLQSRRHPMWEWLFSHPVQPEPVFLAEMLSPIAANPIYWGGPLFAGVVYGYFYDAWVGVLATIVIGVPVTVAAACLGKAIEIGIVLRFSPRKRGAMIGILSWLGYASLILFFVTLGVREELVRIAAHLLSFLTVLPWPWLGWFLGASGNGFSFLAGMIACWLASAVTIAAATWFAVWGAGQGLSGNVGAADTVTRRSGAGAGFGREPLYRKEFLWFVRDRSAIVQTILIPLTVASVQVFNLRGLFSNAQHAWNYLCAVGILFGTYFLWILGPKSLASEGQALWIAMTWPRGMENLLKAKAWLWSIISSVLVGLVLGYTVFVFPKSLWQIALVGVGWFLFSRSMAEKTVTLVTVTSESGEQQPIPKGRRWAAQLGMLTFAIGIFTQQWHLAVVGIVYSYLTAAAMWENFRARLPFLYDPWSEQLPPPPTLMHAMIAISILVEAGAVVTGIVIGVGGRDNLGVSMAVGYAICSVAVCFGMVSFLGNREVTLADVCYWGNDARDGVRRWWRFDTPAKRQFVLQLLAAAACGIVLAIFAHFYWELLKLFPATNELVRKSQEQMAKIPDLKASYFVMAVLFAPFAEEYLFRGLLYRALDREWGGWKAVVGSAAFFAIYHPLLAWPAVWLLGVTNAILFKKTGRLAPAVLLHMVYNACVLR